MAQARRRRVLLLAEAARVEDAAVRLGEADAEVLTAASVPEARDCLWTGEVDRVVCTDAADAVELREDVEAPVVLLGSDEAAAPEGVAAAGPDLEAPPDELLAGVETAVERQRLAADADPGPPDDRLDPVDPDYRTLVEDGGSAMFLATDGQVRWVNERLADLLWYDPGELAGTRLVALVAEGDRKAMARAADPGAEQQVAVAGRRKDGSTVPLFVRTSPVEQDGELMVAGTVLPREQGRVDDLVDGGNPVAESR